MKSSDENERYQRYLCSPEWGRKRRAVMGRCGEWCERCHNAKMTHVHHLTYIRKYDELPEDLQGVCAPCHDFIHGRCPTDPLATAPPFLAGHPIRRVYLAGKISGAEWRKGLVDHDDRDRYKNNLYIDVNMDSHDWFAANVVPVPGDGRWLDYVGPFKVDRCGTGGHGIGDGAGMGAHAYGELTYEARHGGESDTYSTDCREVVGKCLNGVGLADLVFAWIEDKYCYGTICEISHAYSLRGMRSSILGGEHARCICFDGTTYRMVGPLIVVAFANGGLKLDQWFPASMADIVITSPNQGTPVEAWELLWWRYKGIAPFENRLKQVGREEKSVYDR